MENIPYIGYIERKIIHIIVILIMKHGKKTPFFPCFGFPISKTILSTYYGIKHIKWKGFLLKLKFSANK